MKILNRRGEKDYYDYLVSIMGMDEKVVYDRRNSTVVHASDIHLFDFPTGYDLYFSRKPFKCDEPKKRIKGWSSAKYVNRTQRWKKFKHSDYIEEGSIYHLFLEVGYHQFIFEVERYLDKEGELHVDTELVDHREVKKDKKKSEAPLFIGELHFKYCDVEGKINGIDNPILTETWIPKFIPANDIWNMLYEYISSLNDKEFTDTRTNDQHIESHGFDKKISFRHRK
jgi:hypothetical protein